MIAYFTVTVEAGDDLVLIQPFLLYYIDYVVLMQIVFFKQNLFTFIRKGRRFNFINLSLTFTQRLGHQAHNCKMAYWSSMYIL